MQNDLLYTFAVEKTEAFIVNYLPTLRLIAVSELELGVNQLYSRIDC